MFVSRTAVVTVMCDVICQCPSIDRDLSFVGYPDQMSSSQSQLAGPDGKVEQSKENSFVDFSKVNPCRAMTSNLQSLDELSFWEIKHLIHMFA